jgi:ATP-binding cassette subfamily B protein
MSDLSLGMEENLQGVRVVRAFAAKVREMERFDTVSESALQLSNRRISLRMSSVSVMNLAYYASMGLVLFVGGRWVSEGSLRVGELTEFLAFMTILQQPVRQVGMIVNSGARASSAGQRLFEVLDATPDIRDRPGAAELVISAGVLRFENVGFRYDPASEGAVLSGISFELGPGKTLGIVGPPGSGKSTIAHLIPRFYDVSEGRITIDGQDIRDLRLASLRRHVGLVQQEIFLFDTSVHDNVAYADPLADDERVVEASSIAQIHEHVASLPKAYRTRVGERGVALSGGQRQRMSIARGLLAAPRILILDDAMSAIDAATEQQVRAALRGAVSAMGSIVIAHRLSALRHADEIIVLERGRIAERGSHDRLLAAGGAYAELWALQNHAASGRQLGEAAL